MTAPFLGSPFPLSHPTIQQLSWFYLKNISSLTTSPILHCFHPTSLPLLSLAQKISIISWLVSLLLPLPLSVSFQHSIQNDSVKMYMRSCHSIAQNSLKVSHLSYDKSQSPCWDSHSPIWSIPCHFHYSSLGLLLGQSAVATWASLLLFKHNKNIHVLELWDIRSPLPRMLFFLPRRSLVWFPCSLEAAFSWRRAPRPSLLRAPKISASQADSSYSPSILYFP